MGKIRTYGGRLVDPFNLVTEDIVPEVFIHALSQINRFTGHTHYPFSVAQHSVNLVYSVPEHLKRAALIHDWSEALFNDLASPVKRECRSYRYAEHAAAVFIAGTMNVSGVQLDLVSQYDKQMYKNEREHLIIVGDEVGMGDDLEALPRSPDFHFCEMNWRQARHNMCVQFQRLWPNWKNMGASLDDSNNSAS